MKQHLVGRVEELPPGSRKLVDIEGRTVGVFNIDNNYYALSNTCPHAGGPLCSGDLTGTTVPGEQHYFLDWINEGKILRCPWHAWEFYIDSGQAVGDAKFKVPTYNVILEDGNIFVET